MRELFGDSSRDGEWAAVRLLVDGDRIVEADAPGLERDLAGLTLLEAAAVGGEPLAADALANALGPVFRVAPAGSTTTSGSVSRRCSRTSETRRVISMRPVWPSATASSHYSEIHRFDYKCWSTWRVPVNGSKPTLISTCR